MIPRYTLPEMAAVWSEQAKLDGWTRVEVLACEAWARLGRIPPDDLADIRAKATPHPRYFSLSPSRRRPVR